MSKPQHQHHLHLHPSAISVFRHNGNFKFAPKRLECCEPGGDEQEMVAPTRGQLGSQTAFF